MSSEFRLACAQILKDAACQGIDLLLREHRYTLWRKANDFYQYCGSSLGSDEIYKIAGQQSLSDILLIFECHDLYTGLQRYERSVDGSVNVYDYRTGMPGRRLSRVLGQEKEAGFHVAPLSLSTSSMKQN